MSRDPSLSCNDVLWPSREGRRSGEKVYASHLPLCENDSQYFHWKETGAWLQSNDERRQLMKGAHGYLMSISATSELSSQLFAQMSGFVLRAVSSLPQEILLVSPLSKAVPKHGLKHSPHRLVSAHI